MVDMAALQVQPSSFDPMKALLVASQLRQADATNTLANLSIQDRLDAKNGLADYSRMDAAGDPDGAMRALTKASPQMAMHVMQLKKAGLDLDNEQIQQKLVKNGRDAMYVASMPEGAERDQAWQDRLKTAASEKRITPEQYDAMRQQKPNSLMLNRIVMQGLSLEQYIAQQNKQDDRAEAGKFIDAAKNINNPNANQTVAQATSGAISPLTAADPSQGLPDDSFRAPLQPTPRVTPQQVAQARGQPQLNATTGVQPGAPVPFVSPMGPDSDFGTYSPTGDVSASPAAPAAGDTAPLTPKPVQTERIAPPAASTASGGRGVQRETPQMTRNALLASAAQMAGGDKSRLFDFFLQGSVSPNKQIADASKEMLKIVSEDSKTPEKLKLYSVYLRQMDASGNVDKADDFTTWDRKNSESSRPNVTVDQRGQDELTKKISDTLGELYKDGRKASQDLVGIGRLGKLMEESGTGAGPAWTNFVRQNLGPEVASLFGGKKVGAIEAAHSYVEQMAPTMRQSGSGSSSDIDVKGFKAALPSLMSSVAGRRIIVETLGGMAEYRREQGRIVGDIHSKIMSGDINEATGKKYNTADIDKALDDAWKGSDPFTKFREYQSEQGGKAGAQAPQLPGYATPDAVLQDYKAGKIKGDTTITITAGPKVGHTVTVDELVKSLGPQ